MAKSMHILCAAVPARMWECEQAYYRVNQRGLLQDLIQRERDDNQRILYQDEHVALYPCAPYEVWIARKASCHVYDLTPEQRGTCQSVKSRYPQVRRFVEPPLSLLDGLVPGTSNTSRIAPACRVLSAVPDP